MATIRKRKIGNTEFYYLEHSVKEGNKVRKIEKYIGKILPTNIDSVRIKFLNEIYQNRWRSPLDKIKKKFHTQAHKLPSEIRKKNIEQFMIKFTYNTNRIEGGTLSYKDTAHLLHDNITPANKPTADIKEAESHETVFYAMLNYEKDLKLSTILEWHYALFKETKPGIAGKLRTYPVAISGSKTELPSHLELNALLHEFFRWYEKNKKTLHPVELAALVHLKFVSIHPFGDGNGRISRLIMNFILKKERFPLLDIAYSDRSSYYTALERAHTKKQDNIFVQYIIKRYVKEYKEYIR